MSIIIDGNLLILSDGIGITHCVVGADRPTYPEHFHDFVELVYMLKGHCVHVINGKEYPSQSGDMLIINYGQSHEILGHTNIEYINIYIKPEYVNYALADKENAFALLNLNEFEDFRKIIDKERCHISFHPSERQRIEQLIFMFLDDIEGEDGGRELALRSEMNLILITLFRKLSVKFCESFSSINESLLAYIKQHSDEKLTLERVSALCSYNKSYFSRMFKEYTGETFVSYLKNVRLEKAEVYLRESDFQIEEIVAKSGYTDKTKFFKDFKAKFSKTPLQFRKDNKK